MLIVNDIFESISGEINRFHQGRVTTFIRLQGCNLKCDYCDTPESQPLKPQIAVRASVQDVINEVERFGHKHVLITGGEPSIQEDFFSLCSALKQKEHLVTVETNGTKHFSLDWIDCCVVDYKFQYAQLMKMSMFESLRKELDIIKFVVSKVTEIDEAETIMKYFGDKYTYAFSPIVSSITPHALGSILIERKLNVVLSLQIHKLCNFS